MKPPKALFVSVVLLPLGTSSAWRHEKYSAYPQNEVTFSETGLVLRVDESSSPLFHKLEKNQVISGVRVRAQATGLPKLSPEAQDGQPGSDDYVLRLGLVQPGDYRPSWVQRLFAPKWLLNLIEVAGSDSGFSKVRFLDVTQKVGVQKEPVSKGQWIDTQSVRQVSAPGDVSFEVKLAPAVLTSAVWLHADGDDTKSRFVVTVSKIELTTSN